MGTKKENDECNQSTLTLSDAKSEDSASAVERELASLYNAKYSMFQQAGWVETIIYLLVVFSTMAMFIFSNSTTAAQVHLSVNIDYLPIIDDNFVMDQYIFTFDLVSSFQLMIRAGASYLAYIILLFTAVWPYVKSLLLIFCWFVPLREKTRKGFLYILDVFGKWSFIDILFLTILGVGFYLTGDISMDILTLKIRGRVEITLQDYASVYMLVAGTMFSLGQAQYTMMRQFQMERQHYNSALGFIDDGDVTIPYIDRCNPKYVQQKENRVSNKGKLHSKWEDFLLQNTRKIGLAMLILNTASIGLLIPALVLPVVSLDYSGAIPELLALPVAQYSIVSLGHTFAKSTGISAGTIFILVFYFGILVGFPVILNAFSIPAAWFVNLSTRSHFFGVKRNTCRLILNQVVEYTFSWMCLDVFLVACGMGMLYINDLVATATGEGLANVIIPQQLINDIPLIGNLNLDLESLIGDLCNLDGSYANDNPPCLHVKPTLKIGYFLICGAVITLGISVVISNYLLDCEIDYYDIKTIENEKSLRGTGRKSSSIEKPNQCAPQSKVRPQ